VVPEGARRPVADLDAALQRRPQAMPPVSLADESQGSFATGFALVDVNFRVKSGQAVS